MAESKSRSLKDELLPEGLIEEEQKPIMMNSLQLPLSEDQEKELIKIVLQDFKSAQDDREKTDWGHNAKGEGRGLEGAATR